ncbi:hypothetical protein Xbed_03169 [Xenorhabdus beddingii]|uniref:Uncharacterized protein n=1 Tax=Xenorhabdus beddingii TaxID=40578 RepID=A0A1Y2SHR3_9GAMM|nr:KilA-N domain-containing protein [Xenorhabdus beddingii]OTA18172.1 hypothetical protein Xbed_03169 [Xenorhabdus beddingii]
MKSRSNKSKTPTAATIGASKTSVTLEETNAPTTNQEIDSMSITTKALPVIAGVEITTDSEGRFNLNALHKASGAGESKKPSQWLGVNQR